VYDADGNRLLRATAEGRTLYLAGHEISASPDGSTVTATRSYSLADTLVATRTPAGVSYLLTDEQGSVEASVPSGATALQVTRAYAPYGQRRSGGELATDRGWLGQVEDDRTRLSYLNARYYDPHLARFISPDPIYDESEPQSLNPYAYGLNNPVANADPDGLKAKKKMGILRKPIGSAIRRAVVAAARVVAAVAAAARAIVRAAARVAAVARKAAAKAFYLAKYTAKKAAAAKAKKAAALKAAKDRKTLLALRRANPDPAFWRWIAKAGPKAAATARWLERQKKIQKLNAIAGALSGALAGAAAAARAAQEDDNDDGCGLSWSGLGSSG
jgi:RHS repeat-associated protein